MRLISAAILVLIIFMPTQAQETYSILFVAEEGDDVGLYEYTPDDGTITRFMDDSLPAITQYMRLSGDGNWLSFYIYAKNAYHFVDVDNRQLLDKNFDANELSWSPTGQYLAVVERANIRKMWIIDMATMDVQDVPIDDITPYSVSWSADGNQVVFSVRWVNSVIYVYNPETDTLTPLTNEDEHSKFPKVSENGRQVTYVSDSEGYESLFVVDIHTGETRMITDVPTMFQRTDYRLVPNRWLNDDSQILLLAHNDGISELHLVDVETGDSQRYIPQSAHVFVYTPSPDESLLAMQMGGDGGQSLFIVDIESGEVLIQQSEGFQVISEFIWSPDSQSVFFSASDNDSTTSDLYRLDISTGDLSNLTNDSAYQSAVIRIEN